MKRCRCMRDNELKLEDFYEEAVEAKRGLEEGVS